MTLCNLESNQLNDENIRKYFDIYFMLGVHKNQILNWIRTFTFSNIHLQVHSLLTHNQNLIIFYIFF